MHLCAINKLQTSSALPSLSPVSQPQDEELQEGRVYEQVLVFAVELGEPGQPLGPAPRGFHGDGEQPIEELDLLGVGGGRGGVRRAELWEGQRRRGLTTTTFCFLFHVCVSI